MRRTLLAIAVIGVLAGLVVLVWLRSGKAPDDEASVETEVAVHIAKITRTTLRAYVTAYGVVEPAPPGEHPAAGARVAPTVSGVVTAVRCAEGQHVDKGAVLFQLDSRTADVTADRAREAVEFATKNLERQKRLIQVEATSQKLVLDAEQAFASARNELSAAQTQQALLRVVAPLSGTVTRINVSSGEAVDLTTTLAEVVDLDRLVVRAGVPRAELVPLKVGQPVDVLVDTSSAPVRGGLIYIGSEVDAKTGTAPVRVSVPPGSGVRPGQFVTLRIVSEERKDRLAVPVESVVKNSEGATVIALVQSDRAVQKPVKAGLRDGDLVEVEADGLHEGMPVVSEGAYGLPKETKIRVLGK